MSKERKKKFMKKTMKKLIALVTVFVMLLTVIPVFAAGQYCIYGDDTVSAVFYPNQKMYNQYFGNVGSEKKIQVKSSNSKVGVCITEKYEYGYNLYFKAKRPGTTTLTIKVGNETKKVKAIVANYTNPVSSIELGNTKISGSKFNKADKITTSYAKYANKKVKINVTGKKGWKVLYVDYLKKGWRKTERVKNGAKLPVNGGTGYIVMVTLENEKTGLQEIIQMTLK